MADYWTFPPLLHIVLATKSRHNQSDLKQGESPLIDIELLIHHLRLRGHQIDSVTASQQNEGDFDFMIDGTILTLSDGSAPAAQTIH